MHAIFFENQKTVRVLLSDSRIVVDDDNEIELEFKPTLHVFFNITDRISCHSM
jgi:hypothetical protein